ncbi:hypothetical protein [Shewanella algae]|uniref:hypothetical protein n=1 Tax=Shewanella algae TaxID=38313 RepID=UPI0031F5B453
MKSAPLSLTVFGVYMMLVPGIGLMTMPETLLNLFWLSHGSYFWAVRVVGLLAFIIGSYQFCIAKFQLESLYKITVAQRYLAALVFVGLWVAGESEIAILLFAAIDIIGATWTLFASSCSSDSGTDSLSANN